MVHLPLPLSSARRWLGLGLLLLGLLAGACQQTPSPASTIAPVGVLSDAIIGGKPDVQNPGVGALAISKRTFCTGTLIASRVVLTAGHCIDSARSRGAQGTLQFRIDVPNPQSTDGYDATYYDIEFNLLSVHPSWNGNASRGFDLGIAILKQKVPASAAKVIPFNSDALNAQWVGKEPLFQGYGYTQSVPSAITPDAKYGTTIPIIKVTTNAIEHSAPGKSVCHGDSGGPALFTIGGLLKVIAVNSYVTAPQVPNSNPPRSSCDATGVSYRTDVYKRYINSILIQYGDGPATCTADADCGVCSSCGAAKSCEPKAFPTVPTSCGPCQQNSDCGQDGLCHRFEAGFRCLQACTPDGCCPDGTVCTPLSKGNQQWHCVPKANKCDDVKCTVATDCGPGEKCEAGVCRPSVPPRSPKLCHPCSSVHDCDSPQHLCYGPKGNEQCLQPCGAGDFCPDGFSCKQLYPGAPKQCAPDGGTCLVPCQLDEHCPTGFACTKGACGRKDGGVHGDTCDPTPCKAPFECAATLAGKRCMQPCGVANGNAGSPCDGNTCSDGSRCFAFGDDFKVCLRSCQSSSDCTSSGGGRCYQGICICRGDSECGQGYTCNNSTRSIGACAKADVAKPCPGGFECRVFSDGPFCVPEGGGVRSLGESCDSLNRCNDGLVCIGADSGPVCVEDCTQSRQCKLGGRCVQYSRSLSLCLCSGGDCPSGRQCQPMVQGQYGVCLDQGAKPGCIASSECPPKHTCKLGACVADPPAPKESTPEPVVEVAPEPSGQDGGSEPLADATTPEPASEPAPDAAPDQRLTLDAQVKPPGGCGCAMGQPGLPPAWPLSLLLLALLLPWRRRS